MILIPTKSVTFAHCGLVFVDKASTDDEGQKPSSPTGGLPNLQPSTPYLQKAALQPYQRTAHSAAKHPTLQEADIQPYRKPAHSAGSTPTPQPKPLTRRGQSSETTE